MGASIPSHTEKLFLKDLSQNQIRQLDKGEVLVYSEINSKEIKVNGQNTKTQAFEYFAAGKHPKSCTKALYKMSFYEKYDSYIDFIQKSHYNEVSKELYFHFDHGLLPFPIRLNFKIERITTTGIYKYYFDNGFLKGLEGNIKVDHYQDKCLFQIDAHWVGPDTGVNDTIFEMFTTTLGKLGIQKIFRISQI